MGVDGVWDLVRKVIKSRSLREMAVRHFIVNKDLFVVGVDAANWCYEVERVASGGGKIAYGRRLAIIFFKLARLASLPLSVLFVEDGIDRPHVKRNKTIRTTRKPMISDMQSLCEAFGFGWWKAPGEAEAELAKLNQLKKIDAVMTEDSDALLFGAETVIRRARDAKPNHEYTVNVVTATDIKDMPNGFGRKFILLLAVLSGADYNTAGLPGCGPDMVLKLSRSEYHFDEELWTAAITTQNNRKAFCQFLGTWRKALTAEFSKKSGKTSSKKLAKTLATMPSFPDPANVLAYALPSITGNELVTMERPTRSHLNVAKLTRLCEAQFTFGSSVRVLLEKLVIVTPGAFIMDGLVGDYRGNNSEQTMPRTAKRIQVLSKRPASYGGDYSEFRCSLLTNVVWSQIKSSSSRVQDNTDLSWINSTKTGNKKQSGTCDTSRFVAWIPGPFCHAIMRDTMERFEKRFEKKSVPAASLSLPGPSSWHEAASNKYSVTDLTGDVDEDSDTVISEAESEVEFMYVEDQSGVLSVDHS